MNLSLSLRKTWIPPLKVGLHIHLKEEIHGETGDGNKTRHGNFIRCLLEGSLSTITANYALNSLFPSVTYSPRSGFTLFETFQCLNRFIVSDR